jgi:hypothetical protein
VSLHTQRDERAETTAPPESQSEPGLSALTSLFGKAASRADLFIPLPAHRIPTPLKAMGLLRGVPRWALCAQKVPPSFAADPSSLRNPCQRNSLLYRFLYGCSEFVARPLPRLIGLAERSAGAPHTV